MGSQAVRGYGITCPNDVDGIISTAGGIGMNRYGNGTPQARGDRGEEPYRVREAR